MILSFLAVISILACLLANLILSRLVAGTEEVSKSVRLGGLVFTAICLTGFFHILITDTKYIVIFPFACAQYVIFVLDLSFRRIPNFVNLITLGSQSFVLFADWIIASTFDLGEIIISGVSLFTFFLILNLLSRNRIGMGDVKLAFTIGLIVGVAGFEWLVYSILSIFVLGGIVATTLLMFGKIDRRDEFAFGPIMLAGCWITLLLAIGVS